jgi:hypothetical protein
MSFVGSNAFLVVQPREAVYAAGDQLNAIMIAPPLAGS